MNLGPGAPQRLGSASLGYVIPTLDDNIGPMFVHNSREVERPYHQLRPALIDGPSWLASLAPPALIEALELTSKTPFAADQHETRTLVPAALQCHIGPIRLHVDAIIVPIRWLWDLDLAIFPPVLDADLRLTGSGRTSSQLALSGTYACPTPPADPDMVHQTVQAAIDTYLRDVATNLHDRAT